MTVPSVSFLNSLPGTFSVNVAKSDTVSFATTANQPRGLYIGGAGNVCVRMIYDTAITFNTPETTEWTANRLTATRTVVIGTFDGTAAVDASTDTITMASHGMANGTIVSLVAASGTIVSSVVITKCYFVVGATTNEFQLSLTDGGAAINLTGTVGTNTVTAHYPVAHNLTNGQLVILSTLATDLPGGFTGGIALDTTPYYVVASGTGGASRFQLSASLGGTAVDVTDAGSGVHYLTPVALFSAVPAGTLLPISIAQIYSSVTTATLYTIIW